tara:strand:- start:874 stop:1101 length:228 start_codon:yes stop_codon:yes gene_type:complete
MKQIFLFMISLLLISCSLNKDSDFWNEDSINNKENQKKLTKILKKNDDITEMSIDDYEIYIDDHTKKSKYPDINK